MLRLRISAHIVATNVLGKFVLAGRHNVTYRARVLGINFGRHVSFKSSQINHIIVAVRLLGRVVRRAHDHRLVVEIGTVVVIVNVVVVAVAELLAQSHVRLKVAQVLASHNGIFVFVCAGPLDGRFVVLIFVVVVVCAAAMVVMVAYVFVIRVAFGGRRRIGIAAGVRLAADIHRFDRRV